MVVPQGEGHHPAVFQGVVVDDRGHDGLVHPRQGADRPGRQDVVDVVNAAEGQVEPGAAVDGQDALFQVHGRHGKVRRVAVVAAAFTAVGADMVVVVVVVDHPSPAGRAPGPVVVDPLGGLRVPGAALHAEPLHLLVVPGEAGDQGVVGVEDQGGLGVDGGEDGLVDPLRVAVSGELVTVEVGDDEVGGVEVAEGQPGIALVALQQEHVPPDLAGQGAPGEDQGGDALDLVGALLVVEDGPPVGAQNGGDHLHGGGLAVGAGDGDDVSGQLDPGENIRADLQGEFAGHGAALAHQLAHGTAEFTYQDGEKFFQSASVSFPSGTSRNSATARTGAPSAFSNFSGRA